MKLTAFLLTAALVFPALQSVMAGHGGAAVAGCEIHRAAAAPGDPGPATGEHHPHLPGVDAAAACGTCLAGHCASCVPPVPHLWDPLSPSPDSPVLQGVDERLSKERLAAIFRPPRA